MTIPLRHLPWIGGAAAAAETAQFSPLVSPIDESIDSHFIESDAAIVDAAVRMILARQLTPNHCMAYLQPRKNRGGKVYG